MIVLTKTRNDLKRPETTWNVLQRPKNDLKRPEKTYNEQEMTWNHLKQPIASNKQPEMTFLTNKQPKMTCKEQILISSNSFTWKIIKWRAPMSQRSNRSIPCLPYCVSPVHIRNVDRQKNQNKCQYKTKQSKKTLNNHFTRWL